MNNPARRLHTIITGLKSQSSMRVDEAFAKVFDIDPAKYSLLMKRIGLVFMLLNAIEYAIKSIKEINHEKYLLANLDIGSKMRGLHFAQAIQHSTIAQISDGTMAYLDMTAEYLSKHYPEPTITDENRKKLLDSVFTFWKEVEATTGIPEKLRQFILDKLDLLREAVETYDVCGANPVKEAAESILGGTLLQSFEYKAQTQCIQILDKLLKCAVTAYCSIEFVNNIASLPESMKTIAGFLGAGK